MPSRYAVLQTCAEATAYIPAVAFAAALVSSAAPLDFSGIVAGAVVIVAPAVALRTRTVTGARVARALYFLFGMFSFARLMSAEQSIHSLAVFLWIGTAYFVTMTCVVTLLLRLFPKAAT